MATPTLARIPVVDFLAEEEAREERLWQIAEDIASGVFKPVFDEVVCGTGQ